MLSSTAIQSRSVLGVSVSRRLVVSAYVQIKLCSWASLDLEELECAYSDDNCVECSVMKDAIVDDCDARKDWHWEIADREADESVEVIEPVNDVITSSS